MIGYCSTRPHLFAGGGGLLPGKRTADSNPTILAVSKSGGLTCGEHLYFRNGCIAKAHTGRTGGSKSFGQGHTHRDRRVTLAEEAVLVANWGSGSVTPDVVAFLIGTLRPGSRYGGRQHYVVAMLSDT